MPAINGQKCGICGQDVVDSALAPDKSPYRARDVRRLSCAQCGIYEIARPFYPVSAAEYEPLLPYLAAHIRQANELEKRIPEISSEWPQLAELHRNTSVPQRAEKLLRTIEARAKDPGAFINLDPARDFPLVDSLGEDAIHYYAEYWESVGCVEMAQNQAISDTTMRLRLTVDGWSRLDPIASGGIPGRVFVAMSFNPDLDQAFEHGIYMAIEQDCHMKALRIDREHFTEQISDRILAEIRRSSILVADFTDHKRGVRSL